MIEAIFSVDFKTSPQIDDLNSINHLKAMDQPNHVTEMYINLFL